VSVSRRPRNLTAHALSLDLDQHQSRTPGEMIERVDGDVTDIAEFIVAFLLDVVAGVLLSVGVLALVLLADVRIGLGLIVYLLLVAGGVVRLQRPVVPAMAAYRAASGRLFGHLEERFAAIDDIRAKGAGARSYWSSTTCRRRSTWRPRRCSGKDWRRLRHPPKAPGRRRCWWCRTGRRRWLRPTRSSCWIEAGWLRSAS
jgi:ABC-type multidrug transport system fused ATPase/permease subunit